MVVFRNMRILFIHPPVHDFACHDFWLKPYGFLKLAGLLEQKGAQVFFFDFLDRFAPDVDRAFQKADQFGRGRLPRSFIPKPDLIKHVPRRFKRYGRTMEAFNAFLENIRPIDAVFLTCTMTYWYPGLQELISCLQDAPLILGGSYATLLPEHARSLGMRVVTNDGLEAFLSEFHCTTQELHQAPPYWKGYLFLPYIVTRLSWGCPCSCTYCAIKSFSPTPMVREPDEVAEEVGKSLRPETDHVIFYDDALLMHADRLFETCRKILRFKKVSFHTPNGISIDHITDNVAAGFKANAFSQIYLGYETANDDLQKMVGGKTSRRKFQRAVNALKRADFSLENVFAYILTGHDLLPPSSVEESIAHVLGQGIKPFLAEYSPLPGTKDGDRVLGENAFDPLITNKTSWTYRWAPAETVNRIKDHAHDISSQGRNA